MDRMKNIMEDEVLERNKNLNRGFRKLRVWREAIELYVFVKEALGGIKGLSFKIRDQILDSAFSISSNLAEGYCRRSIKEYIQFVNVALGSAGENYSQMYALLRSGEISQTTFDEFDKWHYGVENKLINLAKALSKKMKTGQDWNSDYKTA
ncbi:MAG: four helix bundle protein [Pseudomonadota bacterium]